MFLDVYLSSLIWTWLLLLLSPGKTDQEWRFTIQELKTRTVPEKRWIIMFLPIDVRAGWNSYLSSKKMKDVSSSKNTRLPISTPPHSMKISRRCSLPKLNTLPKWMFSVHPPTFVILRDIRLECNSSQSLASHNYTTVTWVSLRRRNRRKRDRCLTYLAVSTSHQGAHECDVLHWSVTIWFEHRLGILYRRLRFSGKTAFVDSEVNSL